MWVPLAIFAFLYGLSMDYEVFILARVREAYDETGDTREAVVGGLGRTGRLVTSAALILFLAFVALAASPGTEIKVLATGLAAGHPPRRHRGPGADRPRAGDAVRALELVARAALGAGAARPRVRSLERAEQRGHRRGDEHAADHRAGAPRDEPAGHDAHRVRADRRAPCRRRAPG